MSIFLSVSFHAADEESFATIEVRKKRDHAVCSRLFPLFIHIDILRQILIYRYRVKSFMFGKEFLNLILILIGIQGTCAIYKRSSRTDHL